MNLTSYILSVVGMILISTVVGILLPEGKMAGFVKSIVALFLFFVILTPILQVLSDGELIFTDLEFQLEQEFLESSTQRQVSEKESMLTSRLKNKFDAEFTVEILHVLEDGQIILKNCTIQVYAEESLHINEIKSIKQEAAEFLSLSEEDVLLHER